MKPRERKGKKTNRVRIDVSVHLMKSLVAYLFSTHRSRHFVKKLFVLLNTADESSFTQDPDIEILHAIVNTFVKLNIEENIEDIDLIGERIGSIPRFKDEIVDVMSDIFDISIDSDDAVFIENEFIDRLNHISAVPVVSSLKAAISKFDKNEYDSFAEGIEAIREHTTIFNKSLSMRSSNALTYPEIDFNSSMFDDILVKVHKNLTNEKRYVKTGLKRLNAMLHGGFQPGRVYVWLAVSGGFKSGLLLNMAIWAAKYNRNIRCRDQAKKPMYLYITQENDSEETLDRMFSYIGCAKNGDKYSSVEEIKEAFIKEGIIDCGSHGFKILYFQKNALSSNDMENIVRDIEAEGEHEVKMIVHDYLKRLKPNVAVGDLRIDLGSATNDLSELAKLLKIPIVTANQLNREAYNMLMQQGSNEHKHDLGKKASLTMQSESQMISENADFVGVINKEHVKNLDKWFLTFTDLKNRASKTNKSYANRYFATPFEDGNSMRLKEDEGTEENFSIDSVAGVLEDYNPNGHKGGDSEDDENADTSQQESKRPGKRQGRKTRVNINEEFDDA